MNFRDVFIGSAIAGMFSYIISAVLIPILQVTIGLSVFLIYFSYYSLVDITPFSWEFSDKWDKFNQPEYKQWPTDIVTLYVLNYNPEVPLHQPYSWPDPGERQGKWQGKRKREKLPNVDCFCVWQARILFASMTQKWGAVFISNRSVITINVSFWTYWSYTGDIFRAFNSCSAIKDYYKSIISSHRSPSTWFYRQTSR